MTLRSIAPQGAEFTAALTARLSVLTSEPELTDAWAEYGDILETVREHDLRLLHRFEGVLEHETGDDRVVVRLPSPMSERLIDDLDDAWARLRGRELAHVLRSQGPSLRAIASQVSVSAPYLSQLAGGAGPVPSRAVLGKLIGGIGKLDLPMPQSPGPPGEQFEAIEQRIQLLRERLRDAERRQAIPQVTVEYPQQRVARQMEEQFRSVAVRSLDPDNGGAVREVLAALIEEDDSVLEVLTLVLRDEPLQKAVLSVASLEPDLKRSLLSFLGAMGSRTPAVIRSRREAKAPTPQKSEMAQDDD